MNFVRSLIFLLVLTATALSARAQSPDEQYIRIYQTIQDADRLGSSGQARAAATKYVEAQQALRRFQASYPAWNERVVSYRLDYIASKLEPLTAQLPPPPKPATNVPPGAPTVPTAPVTVTTPPPTAPPAVTPAPVAPPVAPPQPSPAMVTAMAELKEQLTAAHAELEQVRTENNRLGAKLKEALSVQPAAMDPRELAKAEERIRFLEKDNELLRVRLRTATNAPAPAAEGETVADLKSKVAQQGEVIAALRAENEILKKQGSSPAPVVSASVLADTQQLVALRARIATLEAKPVPYTEEELALMSKPATVASANTLVASTGTTPPAAEGSPKKASRELPPGAGPLVAAAERAFAARDFAEAERKYLDVLRQDENNVSILANLASVQLELGRVEEAEKNARKALELDGGDYFAWYVLGRIRFNEEKIDEAIDALSRSAQANPEYAETQNYLGIVLSEKGLRAPAEAALRRAVQLQPNHPAAHNNLAVVYATQTPPALALAKWHYQKALAAGHARNTELEKLLNAGK